MKKISILWLAVLALLAFSCDDDDDASDAAAPVVTLNGITDGSTVAPGTPINVNASVTDDLELASVTVTVTTATGNEIYNNTITTFSDAKSASVSETVNLPGNANTAVAACAKSGEASIVVALPGNTPASDPIHIVGSFNGWDPGDASMQMLMNSADFTVTVAATDKSGKTTTSSATISAVGDGRCISVPFNNGDEYKFARGNWETVEKQFAPDGTCEEVPNRIYEGESEIKIQIQAWRDIDAGCE